MDGYFLTKELVCIGRDDIKHQSSYKVGDYVHFQRERSDFDNRFKMNIVKYSDDDKNEETILGHVHIIHSTKLSPLYDSYVCNSHMCVGGNVVQVWDGQNMIVNIDFYARNDGWRRDNMIADVKHTLMNITGFVMNMYWWEN